MTIEITIPEEWTPGQALAMRALLQHAVLNATPVVAFIRKDATADQLKETTIASRRRSGRPD